MGRIGIGAELSRSISGVARARYALTLHDASDEASRRRRLRDRRISLGMMACVSLALARAAYEMGTVWCIAPGVAAFVLLWRLRTEHIEAGLSSGAMSERSLIESAGLRPRRPTASRVAGRRS